MTARCHGILEDGSVFELSQEPGRPLKIELGQMVRGLNEGFTKLRKGQKARIVCPPEYAYGEAGSPPLIGSNAQITFEVELIDFSVPADFTIA